MCKKDVFVLKKEKIKEKLSDIGFSIFYISLFVFQVIPAFTIVFLEITNPWLWISCILGLIAMIVQAIKFECHNSMMWRAGMIGGVLFAIIWKCFL